VVSSGAASCVAPCQAGHYRHSGDAQNDSVRRRGQAGVRAYAALGGQTEEAYLLQLGELLTLEEAASTLVDLVRVDPATTARA
jgi:hypothetical protein